MNRRSAKIRPPNHSMEQTPRAGENSGLIQALGSAKIIRRNIGAAHLEAVRRVKDNGVKR